MENIGFKYRINCISALLAMMTARIDGGDPDVPVKAPFGEVGTVLLASGYAEALDNNLP